MSDNFLVVKEKTTLSRPYPKNNDAYCFNYSKNDSRIFSAFFGSSTVGVIQYWKQIGVSGNVSNLCRSCFVGIIAVYFADGWLFTIFKKKNNMFENRPSRRAKNF